MSDLNKRKPNVFLYKKKIDPCFTIKKHCPKLSDFTDFVNNEGVLIDGDIRLGSEYEIYYKNEFIKINMENFYIIPQHITEKFDDLIEMFKELFILCEKIGVYLSFELHERDKTFKETSKILGREKIKKICIVASCFKIYFTNNELVLTFSLNNINKLEEYLKYSYELLFEPFISILIAYETIDCEKEMFIASKLNHLQCKHTIEYINKNVDKILINNNQFFTKKDVKYIKNVTGPKSVIENIFLIELCHYYKNFGIIYKTQSNIILKNVIQNNVYNYETIPFHNIKAQTKYREELIKDICIAFAHFMLPPYVLLEIVDWLPNMEYENHVTKINLIISMVESIKKIKKIEI